MQKVKLGTTGMQIAPLVYGTLPLGPLQANVAPERGGQLIRHALERGVDLLDTAELYGTYPHIRTALRDYRAKVRLASKTHAADAAGARAHVEKALRELNVEYLDIVHLHGARIADPVAERGAVLDELCRMRDEGKIGHVGLSSHYVSAIRQAAGHPEIAVVHPLINAVGMGVLGGTGEEMAAAIAEAERAGKGVYAMKALAGGNLIPEARDRLTWVRDLPGVHAIAVGMLDEAEIDANLDLLQGRETDDPQRWSRLQKRRRRLQVMERFCKGCGACMPACASGAIRMVDGRARVSEPECILCGYCAAACPEFLIRVV